MCMSNPNQFATVPPPASARASDSAPAIPPAPAGSEFDTKLSPQEEHKFQEWKAKYAPEDSGVDYDLRGAYKAGVKPDGERGHFPDTFKKPNHPTFSDQSIWNGKPDGKGGVYQGGKWGENDSFTPGPTNLKFRTKAEEKAYFKKVEPNSKLNL